MMSNMNVLLLIIRLKLFRSLQRMRRALATKPRSVVPGYRVDSDQLTVEEVLLSLDDIDDYLS